MVEEESPNDKSQAGYPDKGQQAHLLLVGCKRNSSLLLQTAYFPDKCSAGHIADTNKFRPFQLELLAQLAGIILSTLQVKPKALKTIYNNAWPLRYSDTGWRLALEA